MFLFPSLSLQPVKDSLVHAYASEIELAREQAQARDIEGVIDDAVYKLAVRLSPKYFDRARMSSLVFPQITKDNVDTVRARLKAGGTLNAWAQTQLFRQQIYARWAEILREQGMDSPDAAAWVGWATGAAACPPEAAGACPAAAAGACGASPGCSAVPQATAKIKTNEIINGREVLTRFNLSPAIVVPPYFGGWKITWTILIVLFLTLEPLILGFRQHNGNHKLIVHNRRCNSNTNSG